MKKRYVLFITLFIFRICVAQESGQTIDSLLNVLQVLSSDSREIKLAKGSDTVKVNVLNKLCCQYIGIGDYKKAIQYAESANRLATQLHYKLGISYTCFYKGVIYHEQFLYTKALENYTEALKVFIEISEKQNAADIYIRIGAINEIQGEFEKAINNYLNALKIYEKLKDKQGVADTYNNIGVIYKNQGINSKALVMYFNALKLYEEIGNKPKLASTNNNVGVIYSDNKEYNKALEYYYSSLRINEELGDSLGKGDNYCNIGNIYLFNNKYIEALTYHLRALEIRKQIADKYGITISYINISEIYIKQGKLEYASDYLKKALLLSNEMGYRDITKEIYASFATLFEKRGDFKKAFDYHRQYADVKDSLLNEASSKQITEMNTKYESEKKEKDIELLTKDKALQQLEIGRQKLIRNSFVIGLILAMILAYVLFNRFQLTRKQKQIIESQNDQIVESINYSKRIQDALLPSIESMRKTLPGIFVFYQPKNIVSGDFYFFKEFKNYVLLACVDCTGHGVPGGFMSTLGSLLLDKIADNESLKPSEILTRLNDEIIRILHQRAEGELQDGMDLSVCLINRNNSTVEFSGARNGIIVVSNGEAKRYKASPLPVGGNYMKKGVPVARNFQTQSITLNHTDWVYMYTDGFIEQLGGTEDMPMNYEQFEKHLISLAHKQSLEEKVNKLETELNKWRGVNEITDDVLIMGFQV